MAPCRKLARSGRSRTKAEGAKFRASDDLAVFVEPVADCVAVEFEESTAAAPRGVMLTVELFLHWSAGSRVALELNVISAHCS